MVKKFTLGMAALLLSTAISAQTSWVNFGRSQPTAPEFTVTNSTDHSVVFTMNVYGMFVESKNEGSQTYKRLSLPECNRAGEIGTPEIPVVLS
ncbi:MAG: hypothetical protein LBI82_00005, partial [Dysgonamonadaceae bacterium]|nr:hypothetical protein [Dysgonamonadaceae bacterium]